MTVAPPFEGGVVQVKVTREMPGVAVTDAGASGTVLGVTGAAFVQGLDPPEVDAATRNKYAVPLVKSLILADNSVLTPSATGTQVWPELVLYWMR